MASKDEKRNPGSAADRPAEDRGAVTASVNQGHPAEPSIVEAFKAGRSLQQLDFFLQQSWFRAPGVLVAAEEKGRKFGRAARRLVRAANRDGLQAAVTRAVEEILEIVRRADHGEWLEEREEEWLTGETQLSLPDIRRDMLRQVFRVLGDLRQQVEGQLDEAQCLAFGLGEVVEQGVCHPELYRFFGDAGIAPLKAWQPGDIAPKPTWWEEVRQRWDELKGALPGQPDLGSLPRSVSAGEERQASNDLAQQLAFAMPTEGTGLRPRWDHRWRTLWLGDTLVKQFDKRNKPAHQEKLLDVFQEEGWPTSIDDPLERGKLSQTLVDLNRTVAPGIIRFEADSTKEAVRWVLVNTDEGQ